VYVNRGTTGAIVQRQPFGGWKKSAVGAGTKAGGPHYLFGFGSWTDAESEAVAGPDALAAPALAAVPAADRAWLASALASDASAWASEFSLARDVTGLESEQNVLRYAAVPVTVRVEEASETTLVRVVAAGVRAGSPVVVSSARELSPAVRAWLEGVSVGFAVEDAAEWGRRAARLARSGGRVRLLGGSIAAVAEVTGGSPSVAVYAGDVTRAGQVELLPFLREQAVSITAHRFGTPRRYAVPPLVSAG
ncbi:MAG: NAD-dependent aldehyde dehydrogenase, partial [Microbacterium sp.]|nr:NAD-dependent aldehyde dehydrogenase [Microbacterium sp.]